jgi:DNA polymerase-4
MLSLEGRASSLDLHGPKRLVDALEQTRRAGRREDEIITLLAVSVSHIGGQSELQLELPLGLPGEKHRPGTRQGVARWSADRAMDAIRARFGRDAIGYATVALDRKRSVPDAFRELAEKDLGRD